MSSLLLASASIGVLATVTYVSLVDQVRHLRALDRDAGVADVVCRSALSTYRDRCATVRDKDDWDGWLDAYEALGCAVRDYAAKADVYNSTLDGSLVALTLGRRLGLRPRPARI